MNLKFMNKINNLYKTLMMHSPEILTGVGVSGFLLTVADTVMATIKSVNTVNEYKKNNSIAVLSKKEILKLCWKNYIPAAIGIVSSSSCVILSNRLSYKKNAALAASYAISETALSEYRNATKKIIGTSEEKKVAEEVQKKVETKTGNKEIILDDDKLTLFKEPITEQYFKSTWNDVVAAINRLNSHALSDDGYVTLNRYLSELGCQEQKFGGEDTGWYVGTSRLMEVYIDSCVGPNNEPVLTYYFNNDAKSIFERYHA